MRVRTASLLACTVLIAGCAGPRAIAVINDTDQPFVVRYEGQLAWTVPAGGSGIGPSDLIMGPRLTEILRDDCSWWVSWRLIGPSTIRITDVGVTPSLSGGVKASAQLEPTDRCVPATGSS
jgi:hypothetical protein